MRTLAKVVAITLFGMILWNGFTEYAEYMQLPHVEEDHNTIVHIIIGLTLITTAKVLLLVILNKEKVLRLDGLLASILFSISLFVFMNSENFEVIRGPIVNIIGLSGYELFSYLLDSTIVTLCYNYFKNSQLTERYSSPEYV